MGRLRGRLLEMKYTNDRAAIAMRWWESRRISVESLRGNFFGRIFQVSHEIQAFPADTIDREVASSYR